MNEKNKKVLEQIKGGLIVSCQALEDEPLHDSYIMSRMAFAASEGGAVGIRANTVEDIKEIKNTVNLPLIGIIKKVYPDSDVYITPTTDEVDALYNEGVDIIAVDATNRPRPNGVSFEEFFRKFAKNIRNSSLWRMPHALKRASLLWSLAATLSEQQCADIRPIQKVRLYLRLTLLRDIIGSSVQRLSPRAVSGIPNSL